MLINNSRKMEKLNIGERLSRQIKASRYVKKGKCFEVHFLEFGSSTVSSYFG